MTWQRRTLCAALAVMSLEGRFTPDTAHTIARDQCDALPAGVLPMEAGARRERAGGDPRVIRTWPGWEASRNGG